MSSIATSLASCSTFLPQDTHSSPIRYTFPTPLHGLFSRASDTLAFVQAQTDDLECKISTCKQALTAARDKQTQLQRSSIALSTRSAEAAVVLATLSDGTPACPGARPAPPIAASPASVSGLGASATAASARACLVNRDTSAATSAAIGHSTATSARSHADTSMTAVVPLINRHRLGSFYDPPGRDAWDKAPRAIDSFRCCAGISYDDLRDVCEGTSDLIDFSQQSIVSLIEKASRRKVAQWTNRGPRVSGDDICWFPQMHYDAAPGVPFSSSATISSPECLASLAIQIQLSRLHYALVNAATDSINAYGGGIDTTEAASEASPSNKAPHRPPPEHPCPTAAPPPTSPAASPPALDVPGSCRSAGTAAEAAAHERSAAVELGEDTARSTPPRWSGRVRCGVDETHDGRAAVRWAVRSLVRRFCTLVPLHTIHELLECFHVALLRTIGSARQGSGASSGGGGGSLQEFTVRAVVAALGVTYLLAEEIAAVACMRVLQDLVRVPGMPPLRSLVAVCSCCADIMPASAQLPNKTDQLISGAVWKLLKPSRSLHVLLRSLFLCRTAAQRRCGRDCVVCCRQLQCAWTVSYSMRPSCLI